MSNPATSEIDGSAEINLSEILTDHEIKQLSALALVDGHSIHNLDAIAQSAVRWYLTTRRSDPSFPEQLAAARKRVAEADPEAARQHQIRRDAKTVSVPRLATEYGLPKVASNVFHSLAGDQAEVGSSKLLDDITERLTVNNPGLDAIISVYANGDRDISDAMILTHEVLRRQAEVDAFHRMVS